MHAQMGHISSRARPFLPIQRGGIAIDIIAIAANLFLFPLLLSRVGNLFDQSFANDEFAFKTLGGLMAVILAGRLFGLYLKRFPLQARLGAAEQTSFPAYFFILNIGVLVLNAAFVVTFLQYLLADIGVVERSYGGVPKESQTAMLIGVFAMLVVMAVEVYLIVRLRKPLSERERELKAEGDWRFGPFGELTADFGLFAYIMIWQVFYNNTAYILMTPAPNMTESTELKIVGAVFTFICFLIFYLSPRTVFLIEDRKYLGTWVFIFGVYLSSVLRYW